MARFVHSAGEVVTTFGYHPQPADLLALLQAIRVALLVVVGGRARDVVDHVGSIRTAAEVALPRGLYWSAGLDEPLAMVVITGATSNGVAVDVAEPTDDEPLRDAHDWAEQLWDDGQAVPIPAFVVGDDVVTRAGGQDSWVRERALNAGSWLYNVRRDGTRGLALDAVVVVELSAFPTRARQHRLLCTSQTWANRELVVVHSEPRELRARATAIPAPGCRDDVLRRAGGQIIASTQE